MAVSTTFVHEGSYYSASDTVTGVPVGTAFADRVVAMFIFTDTAFTSGSIGGVSATFTDGSAGSGIFGWLTAVVPTGTAASVVASGVSSLEIFGVWSLAGKPTLIPDINTVTSSPTTIDTTAGNAVLGVVIDVSAASPLSFTTGIMNDGATFPTNGGFTSQCGHLDSSTTQTVTVNCPALVFGFILLASFNFNDASPTLSAEAGSFSVGGRAASLMIAQSAVVGAFLVTGNAASFVNNVWIITASVGTFALSGQDAIFSVRGLWAQIAPGSDVWSGATTQSETWTPAQVQSETWTAATRQDETWTPISVSSATWAPK